MSIAALSPESPTSPPALPARVRFGACEVQPRERRLLVDGVPAPLGARAFDLLVALVERPGELIGKNALLERVWPGVIVEEANIAVQVSALRKVLGGDVIATIPGRGYRFTAAIEGTPAGSSAAAEPAAVPPPAAPKLQTNLPATLADLLGREDDLIALEALVARHRLVTVLGAGGMGKTLLAQHLLRRRTDAYRQGVCWVDLTTVSDPDALPSAIAAAIGVPLDSKQAVPALVEALSPLHMLVVLDNAEHLLDGVAALAGAIHADASGIELLVTSQVPLGLRAERVYRLGALAIPPHPCDAAEALRYSAVAMFVERAQAADARFALTDATAPIVIELCRALDGLPLAIELAAARAPMLGVRTLAEAMHERLRVLVAGRGRAAPARHQTLRAALEWSHGFLDESERTVFRRLAALASNADLELIRDVVGDPPGAGGLDEWTVLDALGVLVDRSLVVLVDPDGTADDEPPRYRLLESPRAYASEQLANAGEQAELARRHAHAMTARADRYWEDLYAGRQPENRVLRRYRHDLENFEAAWKWGLRERDANSVVAITCVLCRIGPIDDIHRQLRRHALIEPAQPFLSDPAVSNVRRLRLLIVVSEAYMDSHAARAFEATEKAVAVAQAVRVETGDAFLSYHALVQHGSAAARTNRLEVCRRALADAQALVDPHWPAIRRRVLAMSRVTLGMVSNAPEEAKAALQEYARLDQEADTGEGATLDVIDDLLADAYLAAGDVDNAIRAGIAAVAQKEGRRHAFRLSFAQLNLAAAYLAHDRVADARPLAATAWPYALRHGQNGWWADYLALLVALEGRFALSARIAGYADAVYRRQEDHRQPNEAAALTRARALVLAALGSDEQRRLEVEGESLADDAVAAIVFEGR